MLIGGWSEVEYRPMDQFVAMLEDLAGRRSDPEWRNGVLADIEARWSMLERVRAAGIQVG